MTMTAAAADTDGRVADTSMEGDVAAPRGFRGLAALAARDVTPPVGIRNRHWGPATADVAAGVHRPFALVALAVRAAGGGRPDRGDRCGRHLVALGVGLHGDA